MKKGYGICPGTCGELVQGYRGKNEYITSYCVDMYSKARITEMPYPVVNRNKKKSVEAMKSVFEYFGEDSAAISHLKLEIKSDIPTGKGMASSTADIGASIMAACDFLSVNPNKEFVSYIASKIEPTDSVFHKEVCLFDPIRGINVENFGFLPFRKVLVLEPLYKINTVRMRKDLMYYKKLKNNSGFSTASFNMLKEAIRTGNKIMVKKACQNSALANEQIKKTPYLKELIDIGEKNRYGFLNISHTGTVVGIGIDENTDIEKILYKIRNSEISGVYRKQYVRSIVKGGLRK